MMLRWKGLDSRRCRFDTFSNQQPRAPNWKWTASTKEAIFEDSRNMCLHVYMYVREREREYMCGIDPFFHCLPIVCSRPWVNRPRRAYDGQNRLALACTRVTTDQEHVTLVAHAYRFRWIRQGRGVVAASVAEDLAAVSTMVLEHTSG